MFLWNKLLAALCFPLKRDFTNLHAEQWDAILEAPHCERIYAGHLRERYAQDPDLKIWQSNKVCRIINVEDLETRDEIRIQARSVGGNKVSHVAIRGADIVYIIHYVRDRLLVVCMIPLLS